MLISYKVAVLKTISSAPKEMEEREKTQKTEGERERFILFLELNSLRSTNKKQENKYKNIHTQCTSANELAI